MVNSSQGHLPGRETKRYLLHGMVPIKGHFTNNLDSRLLCIILNFKLKKHVLRSYLNRLTFKKLDFNKPN